jgi:hypothetical protein
VNPAEGLAHGDERLRELAEVLRVAQAVQNVGIHGAMLVVAQASAYRPALILLWLIGVGL